MLLFCAIHVGPGSRTGLGVLAPNEVLIHQINNLLGFVTSFMGKLHPHRLEVEEKTQDSLKRGVLLQLLPASEGEMPPVSEIVTWVSFNSYLQLKLKEPSSAPWQNPSSDMRSVFGCQPLLAFLPWQISSPEPSPLFPQKT